jgi:uncharacterized protein YndB with AHSA1/START domain
MSSSEFLYVTYIRVTPETLWQALTTSETIEQYRFGMRVESEWTAGSTWRMYADGRLMDSGTILESVSPTRLALSWLCEWKPEFKAEGSSRCVYEIAPTGAAAKLTLTHSMERPNSLFIGAVSEGWPQVLSNLKSLLETGAVALAYHRRHGDE